MTQFQTSIDAEWEERQNQAFKKIHALAEKHHLGHLIDPGGEVYLLPRAECRVSGWDSEEDFTVLKDWLIAQGLEPET